MISIGKLEFGYGKQDSLFKNLNFEQEQGAIVGLFGKNGAGKSTFIKLMSGLLKPNRGVVKVSRFTPFSRCSTFLEDVYLITEELYVPQVSIKTYIKAYAPFYKKFDEGKIYSILHDFELDKNVNLAKISYGQKKKFLIAFALSTNCKYLFLDEPTNGLDIPSKRVFRKVLVSAITDEQIVFVSTHQVGDIETVIDKIVVLHEGKIVFDKSMFEVANKIQFKIQSSLSDHVLYHEKCIEGYKVILPIQDNKNEETHIDIELLLNAIVNKVEI
ncbi:MAG: ATP-binding cassette domain-containing protein [Aestuariibaculum sp.]